MAIKITLLITKQTRQQQDGLDRTVIGLVNGYKVVQGEHNATSITVAYPPEYKESNRYVYMKNAVGGFETKIFTAGEETLTFTLPDTMTHAGNTELVFFAEGNEVVTVWLPVILLVTATGVDYRKVAMASPDLLNQAIRDSTEAVRIAKSIEQRADEGEFIGKQGEKGETGLSIRPEKWYNSVGEMKADLDNQPLGRLAGISKETNDPDNGKVFLRGHDEWEFKFDFADVGMKGETGITPNIQVTAISLSSGEVPTAERSGTNENPLITFAIPEAQLSQQALDIIKSTENLALNASLNSMNSANSAEFSQIQSENAQAAARNAENSSLLSQQAAVAAQLAAEQAVSTSGTRVTENGILQPEIEINKRQLVYVCNGINDNVIITNMTRAFYNSITLSDSANLTIIVNGTVGITPGVTVGAGTSAMNPFRFFDTGITGYTGNRKLYIDWGNASFPSLNRNFAVDSNTYVALFHNNGSFIHHDKLNFNFTITRTSGIAYVIAIGNNGSNCHLSNSNIYCIGIGAGYGVAHYGHYSNVINCNLNSYSTNGGLSFANNANYCKIVNCNLNSYSNGNGDSAANGGTNCLITNCNLNGTNDSNGRGIGNMGANCQIINSALMGLTPTGTSAYGYYSTSTDSTTYHLIQNCTFPLGVRTGFNITPTNVQGIYIGTSANIGAVIKGNIFHSGFTTKITAPTATANKVFVSDNITTLAVTRAVEL